MAKRKFGVVGSKTDAQIQADKVLETSTFYSNDKLIVPSDKDKIYFNGRVIEGGLGKKDDNTDFSEAPPTLTEEQKELLKGEVFNVTELVDFGDGVIPANIAIGMASHAEGSSTIASGQISHAEGSSTIASGQISHAEGNTTTASGIVSHAEGFNTTAIGDFSHAEGSITTADGIASHAEGSNTVAENYAQHSQGQYNTKEQTPSSTTYDPTKTIFAVGNGTEDTKRSDALKMLGNGTTWIAGVGDFNGTNPTETNSLQSVLFEKEIIELPTGYGLSELNAALNDINKFAKVMRGECEEIYKKTYIITSTFNKKRVTIGVLYCIGDSMNHMLEQIYTTNDVITISGDVNNFSGHAHREPYTYYRNYGFKNAPSGVTIGAWSLWKNTSMTASGQGVNSTIIGHAPGASATGKYAVAAGIQTKASGDCSHAEGQGTFAKGALSHAEGFCCPDTVALGTYSFRSDKILSLGETVDSFYSKLGASGMYGSHAEGDNTIAEGMYGSHAEGCITYASGNYSHAEGYGNKASGIASHAEGESTIAENYTQHSQGRFNTKEQAPSPNAYDPTKTIFAVGNGTANTKRSNALKMLGNGTTWIAGVGDFTGTNPTATNSLQAVINTKIVKHDSSEIEAYIQPNIYHIWGVVPSLKVKFKLPNPGYLANYMFEFKTGTPAGTLGIPSYVRWSGETPVLKDNKTYQVSFVNNIGIILEA